MHSETGAHFLDAGDTFAFKKRGRRRCSYLLWCEHPELHADWFGYRFFAKANRTVNLTAFVHDNPELSAFISRKIPHCAFNVLPAPGIATCQTDLKNRDQRTDLPATAEDTAAGDTTSEPIQVQRVQSQDTT